MRRSLPAAVLFLTSVFAHADQPFPTNEGTTWEYESTETLTGTAPIHSVVTVRAGRQLLGGKEVVKLETFAGRILSKTELISADENSVTCLARSRGEGKFTLLNPPQPIIAAPLRVGSAWNLESEVEGIKTLQHFNVVAEEVVTVPAGRFKAFHLHGEDGSLLSIRRDRWFVPGTGFVKEITVLRGPGLMQRVTLELNKIILPEAKSAAQPQPDSSPHVATVDSSPRTSEPSTNPEETASTKKLTVEVSDDPAGGLKTEFESNVAHIYVRWHGHDLPENATVRVTWVAEDVGDLVEPNFIVDETETIAPVPNASARFTLARPPDGWAEGKYRVEFYVDDTLTETVRVTIEK